eukprot:m.144541 g.144541  ORF g.144541 m.144541 type:complete len:619 (+) comp14924_c0_seq4:237-2093(+)
MMEWGKFPRVLWRVCLLAILACNFSHSANAQQPQLQENISVGVPYHEWTTNQSCMVKDVESSLQCNYVLYVEDCFATSRFSYLRLPYCLFPKEKPFAMFILVVWISFCFLNLAMVIDNRVVPNLETIAKSLKMSDSLAGVTLLAFGNGAADVFSAVAAVRATEDGGMLAMAGILGGGLFVTTVVSGVIAFNFEPEASKFTIGRDVFFFLVSLGWVAFMLSDNKITLWEAILFLVLYFVYVCVVAMMERVMMKRKLRVNESDDDDFIPVEDTSEKTPLLASTSESVIETTKSIAAFVTHPAQLYDGPDPRTLSRTLSRIERSESVSALNKDADTPERGTWAYTFSRLDIFDTEGSLWHTKPLYVKIAVILQIPGRMIMLLTTPVVYHEDRAKSWDKNLHVIIALLSVPLLILIFDEDAVSTGPDGSWRETLPSITFGAFVGIGLAGFVALTSEHQGPPLFVVAFAVLGFVMSLAFIYAIANEIVAVMRSFGIILGISESTVGMTVMGIGNGTCDLIANYLVASKGFPGIAISAVYAGPVLNTYVGLGIAALVGYILYKGPYIVEADAQLFLGLAVLMFALCMSLLCSLLFGRLPKFFGGLLISLYGLFFIGSVVLEVSS